MGACQGKESRGVFRGKNDQLVCDSIAKDHEWSHFSGLLIYNEEAYKDAYKSWKQYWEWVDARNDKRWVDQEKGNLDFDKKNMLHCVRLMLSSKHILTEGFPLVRFDGETKEMLMEIRRGNVEYDEIMETVNSLKKELEVLLLKTHIPEKADVRKLNVLYKHINQIAEKTLIK